VHVVLPRTTLRFTAVTIATFPRYYLIFFFPLPLLRFVLRSRCYPVYRWLHLRTRLRYPVDGLHVAVLTRYVTVAGCAPPRCTFTVFLHAPLLRTDCTFGWLRICHYVRFTGYAVPVRCYRGVIYGWLRTPFYTLLRIYRLRTGSFFTFTVYYYVALVFVYVSLLHRVVVYPYVYRLRCSSHTLPLHTLRLPVGLPFPPHSCSPCCTA